MKFISLKRTIIVFAVLGIIGVFFQKDNATEDSNLEGFQENLHPLSIEYMRQQIYTLY